jgi:hypothetical protein
MGMFDTIYVKKELPLNEELKQLSINWAEIEFQTKDLENCLVEYIISEEGILLEKVIEREFIPYTEEEKKQKGHKSWSIWKDVIHKSEELNPVNHHGILDFYTSVDHTDEEGFWIEFRAYFSYGDLDKITLLKFSKQASSKLNAKRWKESAELQEKKLWNRIKRFLNYFGWRKFWRMVSGMCYKMSQLFSSIQMFIIRHF